MDYNNKDVAMDFVHCVFECLYCESTERIRDRLKEVVLISFVNMHWNKPSKTESTIVQQLPLIISNICSFGKNLILLLNVLALWSGH